MKEKLSHVRDRFGFIPESHFENEPSGPPKTPAQWQAQWAEKIAAFEKDRDTTG
jgi:hypothetical protein